PMAIPIAVPAMPDSARGVSKQRSSPNCWLKPSVIRKTPPSVPTSSPKTTTMSSADISSARAALSAAARVREDFSFVMPMLLMLSYLRREHRAQVLLPTGRVARLTVAFAPCTRDQISPGVADLLADPWPRAVPTRPLRHHLDTGSPGPRSDPRS